MPPRSRRRQRRRKALTLHVDVFNSRDFPPSRDWAELPLDAMTYILRKLDLLELLTGGAAAVCRSWRHAARNVPEMCRRIDMRGWSHRGLDGLARAAVQLSAGQCEAFCGKRIDDDFLLFLASQAPWLRRLCLKLCYKVTPEGFAAAITKFALLEELELTLCSGIDDTGVFEHVARACPRMKHIIHINYSERFHRDDLDETNEDREAMAIASMPQLRSLQLYRDLMTSRGLTLIIDNCPHLESLDLRSCVNIRMDDALWAKCSRIKTKTLLLWGFAYCPEGVEHGCPICFRTCWKTCHEYDRTRGKEHAYNCTDDSVSDDSSDSHWYDLSDEEETDLEVFEMILDKSARRYKTSLE